jgi:hypothetical protein
MINRQQLLAGVRDSGPMLTNAILFQVTWFACVIGGAAGAPLWGFAGVVALIAFSWTVGLLQRDLRLLAVLGLTGFVVDTAWISLGILDFGDRALAPSWIVALWLGFALTVNHSMGWLRQKPLLAAALAAIFAPVTYLAGARFGAVEIADPLGLALISGAWAIMFLLLFSSASGSQESESVR